MIHLIYIYFIVNAFLAGLWFFDNKGISLTMLVFGLPFCALYVIIYLFIETFGAIDRVLLINGWYRLYFTNYFSKMTDIAIKIRRQQYFKMYGGDKKYMNSNRYERFFLRQLDKKYNYGITKEIRD